MKVVRYFKLGAIRSTNDWAKDNLASFSRDALTVISANEQTAGRGRFGKSWHSPKGVNLYVSFCFFRPEKRLDHLALTQLMAHCVVQLLEDEGFNPELKWPNDVLIDGKKVAGILSETVPIDETCGIVIGLGLNINMEREALVQIAQPTTSLFEESGEKREVSTLLKKLTNLVQTCQV